MSVPPLQTRVAAKTITLDEVESATKKKGGLDMDCLGAPKQKTTLSRVVFCIMKEADVSPSASSSPLAFWTVYIIRFHYGLSRQTPRFK